MTTPTPEPAPLWRRVAAELLGAGLLVTVVVGSGIAAQRLSPGDVGLQLLENSVATALGLAVLIVIFQTVSGAHFNPVVTLADRLLGTPHRASEIVVYLLAQIGGGMGGAVLANLMFEAPTALSAKDRLSAGHLLGEVVATAGLVLLIFALARTVRGAIVAPAVGAYIGICGGELPDHRGRVSSPGRHLHRDRPCCRGCRTGPGSTYRVRALHEPSPNGVPGW